VTMFSATFQLSNDPKYVGW